MSNLLSQPATQAVLSLLALMIVLYVGYRIIESIRPSTSKADMSDQDLAGDFEEMRLEGDISDEELRSIRAVLGKTQVTRDSGSE